MYTQKAMRKGVLEPLRKYVREQRRQSVALASSEVEQHIIEISEHLQNASKDWEQRDVMIRAMEHLENRINHYIENRHVRPATGILQEWAFSAACAAKALEEVVPVPVVVKSECCERCGGPDEYMPRMQG